jgi:indolepyruvate ferredoxin oxidoreductase beta subunit
VAAVDADAISLELGNPQAVNLIVIGRALSTGQLFCSRDELERVIRGKLQHKPSLLQGALASLSAGHDSRH